MSGTQQLGRWMVVVAWLLLLGLLTLLFSQWLEQRNNPNRDLQVSLDGTGSGSVVLKRNRAGHYLAPGRINGVDVNFLVDTGATFVALSSDLADRAGLKRGVRSQAQTASGVVTSWLTVIGDLQLGSLRMHDVRAAIIPEMPDRQVLLGMSFLKHLRLEQHQDELIISLPQAM
ncbi:MAG: retropepsin-like aspartic protease [Candidatus Thiodiazotropha sp.]